MDKIKSLTKENIRDIVMWIFTVGLYVIFPLISEKVGTYRFCSFKANYVVGLTILIGISCLILFKKRKVKIYEILLILYSIIICMSSVFSPYPNYVIFGNAGRGEGLIILLIYLVIFYIMYRNFKYSDKVFNLVTIAVLIVSALGIVQALLGRYYGFAFVKEIEDAEYMAYGNMINPNFFSSFTLIFLPIYIIKYLFTKEDEYIYVCGIIFGALVCSKTLAGYVTLLFMLVIIFMYYFIVKKNYLENIKKLMIILATFIIIFLILNLPNDKVYIKELSSLSKDAKYATEYSKNFGNNRGYIWGLAFNTMKKYPIFGTGPDCFGQEIVINYFHKNDYYFESVLIDKAHCEYLQIAVTTGIPSLIVYTALLISVAVDIIKKYINHVKGNKINTKENIFLVAVSLSVLSYLVQAGANISVTCVAPMFWGMLGIVANLAAKEK